MVAADLDADTQAKVLRQVEFYFSDSNLPGDKFLLNCIEESTDGMVSLPLVCSFSRMRSHLGMKSFGPENMDAEIVAKVAAVLAKSTTLCLSADGTKVGRVAKLKSADEVQAEVNARSIAASPLPYNVTIDTVENFFKLHAKVNSVRLPRVVGAKAFSGFATVELESEEEAKKVLGMKLQLEGAELEMEPKKDFDARQAAVEKSGIRNGHMMKNGSAGRAGEDEEEEDDYPKGLLVVVHLEKIVSKEAGGSVVEPIKEVLQSGEESTLEAVNEALKVVEEANGEAAMEGLEVAKEVLKVAEETRGDTINALLKTVHSDEPTVEDLKTGEENASEDFRKSGGETAGVSGEVTVTVEDTVTVTTDQVMTGEESASTTAEKVVTRTEERVTISTPEVMTTEGEIVPAVVEEIVVGSVTEVSTEAVNKDGDKLDQGPKAQTDPQLQVAREDIKAVLEKFGKINFVDFSRGDLSGYVRFDQAEAAQSARAHAVLASEGGFVVKKHLLTLDAVEGEAERDYWKKLRQGQGKRRDSNHGRGFNDRGRGRGGRFGRGKGGRGRGRWGDRNEERGNFMEGKGKHKRFDDDDDGSHGRKSARTH